MGIYIHLILILFIGGLTGWILFAITFKHLLGMKDTQITMIENIKEDISHIKSEIKDLK